MSKNIDLVADIPGLISIFGDSLYSDFGSVVRELVQNGHDAVLLTGDVSNNKVSVLWDNYESRLIVSDTGIGMSLDEIKSSLNNFAHSDKKEITKKIKSKTGFLEHEDLIGEYGVGFLAAMAASKSLLVFSKKDENYTVWNYHQGESIASIEELQRNTYERRLNDYQISSTNGTTVICNLKDEIIRKYNVDEEEILNSLKKYVALLPVNIFFNEIKVNYPSIIWDSSSEIPSLDWEKIIKDLHDEEVRYLILLDDAPEELKVSGALYIKERSHFWSDPNIDIYIKGMFVSDNPSNITPQWANFVGGVINSNAMSRIVSGEGIKYNDIARKFKSYLNNKLLSSIDKISSLSPKQYRNILGPHDDALKGKACDIPELLESVWDKIPVPSTGGRLFTLNKYIDEISAKTSNKILYVVTEESEFIQADIMSNTTGIPVLNVSQTRDSSFVNRAAKLKSFEIQTANKLAHEHFKKPEASDNYSILINDCEDLMLNAEARLFTPSYVPALLVNDLETASQKEAILEAIKSAEIDGSLFKKLEKTLSSEKNTNLSFYLNTSNRLITELVRTPDPLTRKAVILALYNIAFMNVFRDLKPQNLRIIYDSIERIMSTFISQSNTSVREIEEIINSLGERAVDAMQGDLIQDQYAILMHDMIGSTWIISNIGDSNASKIYQNFTQKLKALSKKYSGFIDKFTGDGVVVAFYPSEGLDIPVRRAVSFSRELISISRDVFDNIEARKLLSKHNIHFSGSRLSISYGECHLGSYGGRLSVFGSPLIEATRIINDNKLYSDSDMIIMTSAAVKAGHYDIVDVETITKEFIGKGLSKPLTLARVK